MGLHGFACLVEQALIADAEQPQLGAGSETSHAAADNRDIEHALAIGLTGGHPRRCGQFEPAKIFEEACFECVETHGVAMIGGLRVGLRVGPRVGLPGVSRKRSHAKGSVKEDIDKSTDVPRDAP